MKDPGLAGVLLHSFCRDEALAGDILEEFERRQSRAWLWRQVLAVVFFGLPYGPVRTRQGGPRMRMPIGFIGVIVLAVFVTMVAPGAWWLIGAGMAGGAVVALLLVARRRNHPLESDTGRHILS